MVTGTAALNGAESCQAPYLSEPAQPHVDTVRLKGEKARNGKDKWSPRVKPLGQEDLSAVPVVGRGCGLGEGSTFFAWDTGDTTPARGMHMWSPDLCLCGGRQTMEHEARFLSNKRRRYTQQESRPEQMAFGYQRLVTSRGREYDPAYSLVEASSVSLRKAEG